MAISLYRTMSLVRSHASSGENFFMVIVRFLETFVGSMSAAHFAVQLSNFVISNAVIPRPFTPVIPVQCERT
ncbi:hypothetical protein RchiOBHm_Chr5g0000041 [Rosa chinensis]|uniref:Uncharacterized protein n=1 Tax=Rosa chinensis TaxID=74649 RepID=A0A2P6Q1W3_ROSCH|nr:hypothetical protein RchiOBHm_Chr5g0000041 [Rosa chinensis]